jgi:hypothetical protein
MNDGKKRLFPVTHFFHRIDLLWCIHEKSAAGIPGNVIDRIIVLFIFFIVADQAASFDLGIFLGMRQQFIDQWTG